MSAHDVQALAELLDGELPTSRRQALETHLSGCASCREELERLRGLSASLRSLPEKPLPTGFLSRLQRRRASGASSRERGRRSFPSGTVVFALSSLLVAAVVVDRARVMLSLGTSSLATDETRLPSAALTEADVEQTRGLKPTKALARAPGIPLEPATMAGASAPLGLGPSNEELHADLERQKKALGIRRIAAKSPDSDDWRKLAGNEALAEAGAAPPAPKIPDAGKPADLKQGQEQAAAGKPLPAPERGAPVASQADAAASAPAAADAPAEGLVIRSEDERQKIWAERGMHLRPPTVRYDRSLIVLVVAVDLRSAVEVLGVHTGADSVSVRYRLFPRIAEIADPNAAAPVRSYQFRVIPKTDKPITFDRVEN